MSKLRHVCPVSAEAGCHMARYHPCLEDFDEDLPRDCQYTDIDGMVECAGYFLFSEFKTRIDPQLDHMPSGGQRLAIERLSKRVDTMTFWLIEGDSANRQCTRMRECINSTWGDWIYLDWQGLKQRHRRWYWDAQLRERKRLDAKFGGNRVEEFMARVPVPE